MGQGVIGDKINMENAGPILSWFPFILIMISIVLIGIGIILPFDLF
jgi:hypothetical protein